MATAPPPNGDSGRTLIYDGLAQNDVDMAHHRLINLDTTNLPPVGIPPTINPPANQWLHDWDGIGHVWTATQPRFQDIAGNLTSAQQQAINALGHVRSGTWEATPLLPDRVPTLDLIRSPQADVSINFNRLIHVADPIDPDDAVNKRFMDLLLQGLQPKQAVRVATTRRTGFTDLQIIDGIQLVDNDRVLVKDDGGGYFNGIYLAHDGNWERSPDCDEQDEFQGAYVTVLEGAANAGTNWVQIGTVTHSPPATGDLVTWVLFSTTSSGIVPGSGLTRDGDTLNVGGTPGRIFVGPDNVDIDPDYAGQNSITTLGTITDGIWNGGIIPSEFGGTGNNNLGFGIHLQGEFSVLNPSLAVGAGLVLRVKGFSDIIVPSGGTLATQGQPETFTNKSIVKRTAKIASNAKPSINVNLVDVFHITGLAENITSMSDNLTGTPVGGQDLFIWFFQSAGDSSSFSINWGAKFIDSTALPLPASTQPTVWLFTWFSYNDTIGKWVLAQALGNIA